MESKPDGSLEWKGTSAEFAAAQGAMIGSPEFPLRACLKSATYVVVFFPFKEPVGVDTCLLLR